MRSFILADKQEIVRWGVIHVIEKLSNPSRIYEVDTKNKLILHLEKMPASVVVFDYSSLGFESVTELLVLKDQFPRTDWVLLSDTFSDVGLKQLQVSKASVSILLKSNSIEEISIGLASAIRGERYICSQVVDNILNNQTNTYRSEKSLLTATEREILIEISLGRTTKEIAVKRNLSIHTVVTHRKNIFRKLEVNSVHEASRYAISTGIVDIIEYYI